MNAPAKPETVAFAQEELVGILLSSLVIQLEQQKNPWPLTAEKNQEIFLNKARENLTSAVKRAVMTIATNRIPSVPVTLVNVKFDGDGVEGKITMGRNILSHDLADAAGQTAYILLANPEAFTGGGEKVSASKDQPDLPAVESKPEIRKQQDRTFTVFKDGIPMPGGTGFKTEQAAKDFLTSLNAPPPEKTGPQETPPPGAQESAQPQILELKEGGYRIVIGDKKPYTFFEGQPAEPFKTMPEAVAWLDEHVNGPAPAGAPPADHVEGQLPEIVKRKSGGFQIVIGEDKHLFKGQPKKPFKSHEVAEKWLQEHLGVEKQKRDATPKGDEAKGDGQTGTAESTAIEQPVPQNWPFPINLEDAQKRFAEAGKTTATDPDGDFDNAMAAMKKQYPPDFVEENLAELEAAFTNAFDAGLGN